MYSMYPSKAGIVRQQRIMPDSYVFLPGAEVFHCSSCRLVAGKKVNRCSSYSAAAETRRPCKICKPAEFSVLKITGLPPADSAQTLPQKAKNPTERNIKKQTPAEVPQAVSVPVREVSTQPVRPVKNKIPVKKDVKKAANAKPKPVQTRMMTGEMMNIELKRIVGDCTYILHPGAMNHKMLLEHDCINKACPYFKKNSIASLWQRKEVCMAEKKLTKQREKSFEEELGAIRDDLQAIADKCGYRILIVRVERITYWKIRLFYVSDNRYGDGQLFLPYIEEVKKAYPQLNVNIRHIKDAEDNFVTIDEYNHRRKK